MAQPSGHTAQLQNWLNLMRAGDQQARQRLIELTCERLRLITRRMLRNSPKVHRWEETDDVLIEALTKLHRSLETTQPESVRGYYNLAATQIRRVLIDLARRYYGPLGPGANQETGGLGPGSVASSREPADAQGEPSDLLQWSEFHHQVETLPEEEREVFNLLWYGGLSQEEAMATLGISERTLRRRWQRARLRLVQAREGQGPPT